MGCLMKNKELTKAKILSAFEQVLVEEGFHQLKVRRIATVAKIDKVLIYRYFDGLEGLATTYAESVEFWPDIEESLSNLSEADFKLKPGDAIRAVIHQHIMAIRSRKATAAILTWELIDTSPVCTIFAEIREKHAQNIYQFLYQTGLFDMQFLSSFGAILGATLNYLVIRSQNESVFSGVSIQSDEGWAQLEDAFVNIALTQVEKL